MDAACSSRVKYIFTFVAWGDVDHVIFLDCKLLETSMLGQNMRRISATMLNDRFLLLFLIRENLYIRVYKN